MQLNAIEGKSHTVAWLRPNSAGVLEQLDFTFRLRHLVRIAAELRLLPEQTTTTLYCNRSIPEFYGRWVSNDENRWHSWRVDGTYVEVHIKWVYLCRTGKKVSFQLGAERS